MIVFIILLIVAILLLIRTERKKFANYDFKCFLLAMKNQPARSEQFIRSLDKKIPLEVIYGKDTRSPQTAREFQDLVDPDYYEKAVEMYEDQTVKRPDITYFNLGAIGCFMRHMEFYKRCFDQGLKYAVIFEDNVIVKSNKLYSEIQKIIDDRGDEFEMCFFHCLSRLPDKRDGKLEKVKWISSTKCYLINVENMKKYTKYFLPMDNHVDMKHEDLIAKGARIYYKDMRNYMKIDRTHNSTIGHSEHGRPRYFSRNNPSATPDDVIFGY